MSRFSLFLVILAALVLSISATAQETWQIDPAHSSAQFSVRHLGVSTVRGAFTKVSGSAKYDAKDPSKTSIDATIDAASVDTRVEMRDNDLRSPNFLDAQKYPTLTFHSKQVQAVEGKLKVTGDLTLHGVTKEVVLDVEGPTAEIKDPFGNRRIGASATAKISRKDFGVNGGSAVVGDELNLTIDVELIRPLK